MKQGAYRFGWKRRWFVLTPHALLSYNSEKHYQKKKGPAKTILLVDVVGEARIVEQDKYHCCIALCTSNRAHFLRQDRTENVQEWCDAIRQQQRSLAQPTQPQIVLPPLHELDIPSSSTTAQPSSSNTPDPPGTTSTMAQLPEKLPWIPSLQDVDLIRDLHNCACRCDRAVLVRCRKDDRIYAMGITNKSRLCDAGGMFVAQQKSMENVQHPSFVALAYAFQTPGYLFQVLDYCPSDSLMHHLDELETLSIGRTSFYAAELLLAMEYWHRQGRILMCIRSDNVYLDEDGHVKLASYWRRNPETDEYYRRSTTDYSPVGLPPETIRGDDPSPAVDFWALGSLIYELLTGQPPWYSDFPLRMLHYVIVRPLIIPLEMDGTASDLITQLLDKDPNTRLTDFEQAKRHPFFAGIDWDALAARRLPAPSLPTVTNNAPTCDGLSVNLNDLTAAHDEGPARNDWEQSYRIRNTKLFETIPYFNKQQITLMTKTNE